MSCLLVASALAAGSAPAAAKPPSQLHATRGDAPGIFDARGREVLLRGVNVNQLGDYYQGNPELPTVVPLRKGDFRRIARIGFNSVRLLISWSKLEPRPGAYNRAYVRRVKRAVSWAESYGLYVILDMHQDAWGKFIDTEPGETCAPGTNPAVGWDGAPEWATLTDGLPTCHLGLRELSPAVGQAWESFYRDRQGIRRHLVETWGRVARSFATEPAVAGWDLLNEPNPGLAPGSNDVEILGEFYDDAIAAIRAGEDSRRGGFSHIVFFEPGVAWSAAASYPTPPPSFTDEENLVFAPHIYAESISPVSIEQGFEFARERAESYGVTVWSGEWGYFSDEPGDDLDKVTRYGEAEDRHQFGGAWWDWKQACGDPHVVTTPGGEPNPISPSLVRYECPSQRSSPPPRTYRDVLSRPAPRTVPGEITSLRSSGTKLTLELEAKTDERRCGLRLFAPSRTGKPRVRGAGISRVRIKRRLGDWSITACAEGEYAVRLAPRS